MIVNCAPTKEGHDLLEILFSFMQIYFGSSTADCQKLARPIRSEEKHFACNIRRSKQI
jgi:hypothetical protein